MNVSRAKYLPSHIRGIQVPKEPKTIGERLRKRRLELGIVQSEAARRLKISTVTLSRWERDKVYPTWTHQPDLKAYLGYDPFTDPALGSPKGNEPSGVAFLSSAAPTNIAQEIRKGCLQMRKTRKQFATELGVDVKTLRNWEANRRQPSAPLLRQILKLLDFNNDY